MRRCTIAPAFVLALCLLIGSSVALAGLGPLVISFIDVGQGDSILLRASDGTDILIDGGPRAAGPTVVAYLQEQNVDDIEVMVVTHAHEDHVGGLIDVLQSSVPVEAIVYGVHGATITYNDFLSAAQAGGLTPTPVTAGDGFTWGAMNVAVLNPQSPLLNDANEDSVTLMVQYGDHRFLFTGDIGSEAEVDILASEASLNADVLKVGHHGSKYASTQAFLNAITPTYAVVQVGEDNTYDHPSPEALSRLAVVGAEVSRTDLVGTVVITSDGQSLWTHRVDLPTMSHTVFIPLVERQGAASPTQPDVQLITIFYDGLVPYVESDEYAVITNAGDAPVNLDGWRLNAGAPGQDFRFPNFLMQPGQTCRVYTNELHPEWCGFTFASNQALWTNAGDCGYLYDDTGTETSTYCY